MSPCDLDLERSANETSSEKPQNITVLTDKQWAAVADALDGRRRGRSERSRRTRLFVDATLWIAHSGRPWSQLPNSFGDKHKCYVRFTRWAREGVWSRVAQGLFETEHFSALLQLSNNYLLRSSYLRIRRNDENQSGAD